MRFFIGCESGSAIGVGHAMRCATLALALADSGHDVEVRTGPLAAFAVDRFRHPRIEHEVIHGDLAPLADAVVADLVVVDGYGLGELSRALRASGHRIAMIDDNGELPVHLADLVVNQNLHAGDVDYSGVIAAGGVVLAGAAYSLVRSEVTAIAPHVPHRMPVDVLISMGGTDPLGLTLPVVRRIVTLSPLHARRIHVAVPNSHPDAPELTALVEASDRLQLADANLTGAFAIVGLAIVGGGSTLWELAALGIPAVVAIVAENQVEGSRAAEESGMGTVVDVRPDQVELDAAAEEIFSAVERLAASLDDRVAMSKSGRSVVDGRGAGRVAAEMVAVASR